MYLSHFGLTEAPFRITPHTDFFFEGANRGATLDALLYAIQHDEGIVKVSGEVGAGKTMLCRVLLERLPETVETIYIATPSLSRDEILRAICEDLKVEVKGKRTTLLLRALQEHLIERYGQGNRVVVLIDEAHAMPPETLEEIRLLSNLESNRHKLLQIVLFGQPELDDHLDVPSMRQLKERITHSFRLEPLVRADIDSYVDFRMRAAGYRGRNAFSPAAQKILSRASEGLTRRINILADKALLAAYADGSHEVTAKHARAAVKDSEFARIGRRGSARTAWIAGAGLAAGLLIGLAGMYYFGWVSGAPVRPAAVAPVSSRDPVPPAGAASAAVSPGPPATPAPIASAPEAPPMAAAPAEAARPVGPPPIAASDLDPRPEIAPASLPADVKTIPALEAGPKPAVSTRPGPAVVAMTAEQLERAPRGEALARERYLLTQEWLKATPPERFSIQLLTAGESDLPWVENFLLQAAERVGSDQLYVYSWRANGRQNYRVAYGTFGTQREGLEALKGLPASMRAWQPYPESVAVMRRLNAQD